MTRRMRRWMLAGVLVLGVGSTACEERGAGSLAPPPGEAPDTRLGRPIDTNAPTGTTVEPGEQPQMGELQKMESERRELYEDVAEDVGVETWPDKRRVQVPGGEAATGGGGAAGSDGDR